MVVCLGAHFHCLRKGFSAEWKEHELLHGELVAGVGATVDDVENGNRHQHLVGLVAGQIGQVAEVGNS